MPLTILRSAIVESALSSNLETNKGEHFHMIAHRGVAKLSTSPEMTIFPPPVPFPFTSDQCLKGDR